MRDYIKEYAIIIDDMSDNAGSKCATYDPENLEHGNFILKKVCHLLTDVSQGKSDKTIPLYDSWFSLTGKISAYFDGTNTLKIKNDITFPNPSKDKIDSEYQRNIIFGLKACIAAYYGLMIPDFLTLTITRENTVLVANTNRSAGDNNEYLIESIGISYGKTDDNLPEGVDIDAYKVSGLSDDRWG
jgi:hypothetical protein